MTAKANNTIKHVQMLDRMNDAMKVINRSFDWFGVADRVRVQTRIYADTVGDIILTVPELDNVAEYRVNVSDNSNGQVAPELVHDVVMQDARQVAAEVIAWVRDECDGEACIAVPQNHRAEVNFYDDVCSLIGAKATCNDANARRWQAVADFLIEDMSTPERVDALCRLARFYGIQTIDTRNI